MKRLAAFVLVFLYATSGFADDTAHRHLGFYLRPDLGLGFGSGSETLSGRDFKASGLAGTFSSDIGGAIAEDNILSGQIWDAVLPNPTISYGGTTASTTDTKYTLFGVGPSFTHYFMPANIYLTGTVAVTRLNLTVNGRSTDAQTGIGVRASVGKEWWVGDHWGIGLNGHVIYSSNQDTGTNPPNITSFLVGAAFSATFN